MRENGWTKAAAAALALMLTNAVTGCASGAAGGRGEAVCDGAEPSARRHAAALAEDGGPRSIATGYDLITDLAAGCEWEGVE